MKITNEWKYILFISVFIVLLSQLPLIFGYATQGEDEVFMGIPVHITDANNHLHWMKQAQEGAFFFTNKFTHEDVPALIFNPYHYMVGNLSRISTLSLLFWYHIISILAIFGFLIYLYYFISHFVKDKTTRYISFILIGLGSGIGVFWKLSKYLFDKWIVSADLWVTDMNVFQSFGHPHFTLSMLLILVTLLHGYIALEKNNTKHAIIAGVSGLLLGLIHLFDIVTVALVLFGWFAYKAIQAKKISWQKTGKLAIIGGIISPAALYYAWIVLFNPTYAEWNALNQTITPLPHELISGLGILFFLAAYEIYAHYKKKKTFSFFSVWFILNLLLVYVPINIQRRFLLGIGIPLGILAALAITKYVLPLAKKYRVKYGVIALLVIVCLTTTIYLIVSQIQHLHYLDEGSTYAHTAYISEDEYNALLWVDEHLNNEVVILAPLHLANHIPVITGNKVYLGHWAQTINFTQKKYLVEMYYVHGVAPLEADIIWNINNDDSATNQSIAYENEEVRLIYN